jgi:cell division protein ZapA
MSEPVKIYILDREFIVACPEDERQALLQSAAMLNQKMLEIRDRGKVVGMDRIAVLAALNLSHELLRLKQDAGGMDHIRDRLAALNERLAEADL